MLTPNPVTPKVFISYRRSDSQAWAGRIADFLRHNSNAEINFDVASIKRGTDYTKAIQRQIASSDVVLVIIGKQWLTASDETGRPRLEMEDDPVRLELINALDEGLGERALIPLLVEGAVMPRRSDLPDEIAELAVRHGLSIDHDSFERDLTDLIRNDIGALESNGQQDSLHRTGQSPAARSGIYRLKVAMGGVILAAAVAVGAIGLERSSQPSAAATSNLDDQKAVIEKAIDAKLNIYEAQIAALRSELSAGRLPAPSASAGTCRPGLSVSPRTSCPFAENINRAFTHSGGKSGLVEAYSPTLKRKFTLYCKKGKPTICSGGNSTQAGVYIR
jgi:hypothetical protein